MKKFIIFLSLLFMGAVIVGNSLAAENNQIEEFDDDEQEVDLALEEVEGLENDMAKLQQELEQSEKEAENLKETVANKVDNRETEKIITKLEDEIIEKIGEKEVEEKIEYNTNEILSAVEEVVKELGAEIKEEEIIKQKINEKDIKKAHQNALLEYQNENLTQAINLMEDTGVEKILNEKPTDLSSGNYINILNDYGYFLSEVGDYKKALPILERVIRLDENRAVAYLNLGDVYQKLADENVGRLYQQYANLLGENANLPDRVAEEIRKLNDMQKRSEIIDKEVSEVKTPAGEEKSIRLTGEAGRVIGASDVIYYDSLLYSGNHKSAANGGGYRFKMKFKGENEADINAFILTAYDESGNKLLEKDFLKSRMEDSGLGLRLQELRGVIDKVASYDLRVHPIHEEMKGITLARKVDTETDRYFEVDEIQLYQNASFGVVKGEVKNNAVLDLKDEDIDKYQPLQSLTDSVAENGLALAIYLYNKEGEEIFRAPIGATKTGEIAEFDQLAEITSEEAVSFDINLTSLHENMIKATTYETAKFKVE